ncbi:SPOSA6832_03315 [Sporobolomyces salmonicolor]|uniref:Checkpoint protein n=1 Tax=Sporidiobolus salmonicolor TaxID=5005 RepID=A0A0D6ENW5_SPOSA|nr:SPOSA6832_03315 [Sporobolomyces salmonicolor]
MRFRADISNPAQFTRLITSLTPLAKVGTIKLTPQTVHLICQGEGTKGGVQNSIFKLDTFRLESNNANEIYLEVSTDALARALKSAQVIMPLSSRTSAEQARPTFLFVVLRRQGATVATIKLAKKGGQGPSGTGKGAHPVLSLVVESASRMGKRLEITQDVFVKVKKAAEIALLKEPLCPEPEVQLVLPPLQLVRTVAERMKTISPYITITANNLGEFRMRAEADEANVETEWRGLKRARMSDEDIEPPELATFFSVRLDTKNLLKFLASYAIAQTCILCLCSDHCAIFYVRVGDSKDRIEGGVLTFFVPAVNPEGDD